MADRQPFDPKTTTFTNLALDEIMPRVSPNAWKAICLALRKTQGWADPNSPTGRKQSDVIAISQFMEGCGIASDHTAKDAVDECVDSGYLLRKPDGRSFRYSLNLSYTIPIGAESAPVGEKIGAESAPLSAQKVRTQTIKNSNLSTPKSGVDAQPTAAPKPPDAVSAHWEFTGCRLNKQACLLLRERVSDLDLWGRVLRWCIAEHGFSPKNIGGMLDKYDHPETMTETRGRPGAAPRSNVQHTFDIINEMIAENEADETKQ